MKSEENKSILFVAEEHDSSSPQSEEVVIPIHKAGFHISSPIFSHHLIDLVYFLYSNA